MKLSAKFKLYRRETLFLFASFLFSLSPNPYTLVSVSAVVTQSMNYQGFLVSKVANAAVDSPQDIRFVIYDAPGGGSALFTESRCNLPVSKGRYDVEIGSATAGGIPDSVFQTPALWLEIQVDPDGDCGGVYEAMQPRIRLQAAPYAFNSLYASTASAATPVFMADTIGTYNQGAYGITVSTNLFVTGGLSVGSISPGQKLSVAGEVESTSGGFRFPDGSLQIEASANTMWDVSGLDIYSINAGNVGIAAAAPQARLHISTGAGETGDILIVSTGASNIFRVNGLGGVYAGAYYGNGASLAGLVVKTGDSMSGQLTIASTLTISGPAGISANRVRFSNNAEISSSTVFGAGLRVSTNVYVIGFASATRYFGDGSGLVGVALASAKVSTAGDSMSGQLTLYDSTLTVTGNAFSVGGSSFSVAYGNAAVGSGAYLARFTVGGGIVATSSITAQAGLYTAGQIYAAGPIRSDQGLTASSGTFWTLGANQYSIETASGVWVKTGVVNAPLFVGNGAGLTSVQGTDSSRVLKSGDTMTGNLTIQGAASLGVVSYGAANTYALTVASAPSVNAYSLAVTTQGSVGIQMPNPPSAPLEVNGQIRISAADNFAKGFLNIMGGAGGDSYIHWGENTGGYYDKGVLGFTGGTNKDLIYRVNAADLSGGQEVFRIKADSAGNWRFGIGVSGPQEKFHVGTNMLVSTAAASPILYISTASGSVSVGTATVSDKLLVNGNLRVTEGSFYGDGSGLVNIAPGSMPAEIIVSTITGSAGAPYGGVVFSSNVFMNGKLGIGLEKQISEPTDNLQVMSSIRIGAATYGDSSAHLSLRPVVGPTYIRWSEATGGYQTKGVLGFAISSKDLQYRTGATSMSDGTEVFRVKEDGKFGVGIAAPLAGFHVATDVLIATAAASPILYVSTAQAAVGVWTSAPAERFHVASTMLVGTSAASPVLYVSTAQAAVGVWTSAPAERFHVASTMLVGPSASPLIYASTASGRVGVGTTAPRALLEIGDGNLLAAGTYTGAQSLPATGAGTRFMWIPSVAAIRSGRVSAARWDTIGLYSVAFGNDNEALGDYSTVSGGYSNKANAASASVAGGNNNVVEGAYGAISGGDQNTVTGEFSVVSGGRYNVVNSSNSWAAGYRNFLTSSSSHTFVWGYSPLAPVQVDVSDAFIVDPVDYGIRMAVGNKNPQARLDVNGNAQFGAGTTKSTFTAEGYWQPRWLTSAELGALAPGAAGRVIGNSSIKDLCISTGAAVAQWALAGSKGIGNCY